MLSTVELRSEAPSPGRTSSVRHLHNLRRPVVVASVICYKPHSHGGGAIRIGRDTDFSRVRAVRLQPSPEMVGEQRQLGLARFPSSVSISARG